jgi:hypothetical protein
MSNPSRITGTAASRIRSNSVVDVTLTRGTVVTVQGVVLATADELALIARGSVAIVWTKVKTAEEASDFDVGKSV